MIRVCIIGNSGHAATVTRALPRLPQVEICGLCRALDGRTHDRSARRLRQTGSDPAQNIPII